MAAPDYTKLPGFTFGAPGYPALESQIQMQCNDGSCTPSVAEASQEVNVTDPAKADDKGWNWDDTTALGGALLGLAFPFAGSALQRYFSDLGKRKGSGSGGGYLPHVAPPSYHPTNYMNPMQQHPSSTSGLFAGAAYAPNKKRG